MRKIWDAAPHNAFTDLIRWHGHWWCTFRESEAHVGGDGKLRVLTSTDGRQWESAALLAETSTDLRDPKLSVTPDDRLMLVAGGSVYLGTKVLKGCQSRVFFSADGRHWSAPQRVLGEGQWLWRVTWHEGRAYGAAYEVRAGSTNGPLNLYESADGLKWKLLSALQLSGRPNETTLRFNARGELLALVRRDAGNRRGMLGVSQPPYAHWTWYELDYQLGGPNFIVLPDGSMLAATRDYTTKPGPTTLVARLTLEGLEPLLTLPSGGDTSYPGLVWHDNELWVSYHSSHEGKTAIYLARVKLVNRWRHLSSRTGDLPAPGPSTEQTGALIADLDRDGTNDFVLSFRKVAPALVWYRRTPHGWDRYVIETNFLTIEAGGAVHDIDGDGYPDLVFGGDWQSKEVWWWRNPGPHFNPAVPWERHVIKSGGATQHHDQVFGDFLGTGKPQLAFWNQGAKKIFLAEIPPDPRHATAWPLTGIFAGEGGEAAREGFKYPEGLAAYDIDADGKIDLLAGNFWLKHRQGTHFDAIRIGTIGGRIAAGQFKPGKYPQVVIAPGDGTGPLRWYECVGNPEISSNWVGHTLLERMVHGHSLQIADIDGDGHLDIFAAEMAKWTERAAQPDNPGANAWIFYGDGQGHFRRTLFAHGIDFHEARLGDLNGDGKIDVLDKPYNWDAPRVDIWLQQ